MSDCLRTDLSQDSRTYSSLMTIDRVLLGRCLRPWPMNLDQILQNPQWRDAFRARVRELLRAIAKTRIWPTLLGYNTGTDYRKYVSGGAGRKTVVPVRLLTRFCLITDRPLEWLIDGPVSSIFSRATEAAKGVSHPRKGGQPLTFLNSGIDHHDERRTRRAQ